MAEFTEDEQMFLERLYDEVYSRPTTYVYDKSESGRGNLDSMSCSYLNYRDLDGDFFAEKVDLSEAEGSCIFGRVLVNNGYIERGRLSTYEGTDIRELLRSLVTDGGENSLNFSDHFKDAMLSVQMAQDAGHPQSFAFMRGLLHLSQHGYDVSDFIGLPPILTPGGSTV